MLYIPPVGKWMCFHGNAGTAGGNSETRRIISIDFTTKSKVRMKTRILTAICLCLLLAGRASAQWAVIDPSNIAQSIINNGKNMVHTSSTATNMVNNFKETVKIYEQGKKYYDALKSVNNLVKDARKVQQTILMVGDITDIYVNNFQKMWRRIRSPQKSNTGFCPLKSRK